MVLSLLLLHPHLRPLLSPARFGRKFCHAVIDTTRSGVCSHPALVSSVWTLEPLVQRAAAAGALVIYDFCLSHVNTGARGSRREQFITHICKIINQRPHDLLNI